VTARGQRGPATARWAAARAPADEAARGGREPGGPAPPLPARPHRRADRRDRAPVPHLPGVPRGASPSPTTRRWPPRKRSARRWSTPWSWKLSLGLEMGLGLLLALTLHARFPLRGLVRTLFLVPLGVPTIVSGAVMLLLFSRSGYLNALVARRSTSPSAGSCSTPSRPSRSSTRFRRRSRPPPAGRARPIRRPADRAGGGRLATRGGPASAGPGRAPAGGGPPRGGRGDRPASRACETPRAAPQSRGRPAGDTPFPRPR
jgi:hypothetical protein